MGFGSGAGSGAGASVAAAFQEGDRVHLRPVAHNWRAETFMVIGLVSHGGWPHYALQAPDGSSWIASQLELSPSPLWDGNENSRPRRLRRSTAAAQVAAEASGTKKAAKGKAAKAKAAKAA
jgi:hypothetical protein